MAVAACPDAEFIRLLEQFGPSETARRLNLTIRPVAERRRRLENKYKRAIKIPEPKTGTLKAAYAEHPHRLAVDISDGMIIVGSDLHAWPTAKPSPAFRAFVKFCRDNSPHTVIMNGDAFDGARISRHPPIGWEKRPTVMDELQTVQARLLEIERAAKKGVRLLWPLGNHDSRFETQLATVAPEYARINGFHLKDHVGPRWESCWSVFINDNTVVKHRGPKGGIHATHNNVLWAGRSIVTGHLHSLKVTPYDDYGSQTRYGVDTGMLANKHDPAFVDYTEDAPLNWRSGFIVLNYKAGRLMLPEIVKVWDDEHVEFRGSVIKV